MLPAPPLADEAEHDLMASRLWFLGSLLVALGIAAHILGWDTLLWIPSMVLETVERNPGTAGLIVAGGTLMVIARLIGRRRD